jgi:hypothetical protein
VGDALVAVRDPSDPQLDTGAPPPVIDRGRVEGRVALAAVALAMLPIVVATVRALLRGWIPIGDNAFFEIRARDVFTSDNPLLGTWTSASTSVGSDLNNPGPLLFDLLALPAKLFGPGGVAIGVAIVNCAAIAGVALLARRRGGPVLVVIAMIGAAGMAWTMGSELLFDPWQPHSLVLPFYCFLFLVWSLTCADFVALPWAVGVASLLVQTHLTFSVLVPVLGVWGIAAGAAALLGIRSNQPGAWPRERRRAWRLAGIAAAVGVVCWAQPLIEQFTSDGEGNMSRILRSTSSSQDAIGLRMGLRMASAVVALPPWFGRPSFRKVFDPLYLGDLPGVGIATVSLVVLGIVLAICAVVSYRRRDGAITRAAATAGLCVLLGLVTTVILPIGEFGIAQHQFRWLWPISAFIFFAIFATAARAAPARAWRAVIGISGTAVAVLALMALPSSNPRVGPSADASAIPNTKKLVSQLGRLEGGGPYVFDLRGERFGEPYTIAVMADLQRRGIRFFVQDNVMTRQLGDRRRDDGTAAARLLLREGDAALTPPDETELVSRVIGLTEAEQDELVRLKVELGEYMAAGRLELSQDGRFILSHGGMPYYEAQVAAPQFDPAPLFDSRELVESVRLGLYTFDDTWAPKFERYADLQDRWDKQTVAVFIGPVESGN